ncbi:AraC family transcriptional regulator [Aeromicrobium sp.]|uniref:AraC family transcriptional regulator n=1 Tax=Aeromicrobium sp. TaxID=1871063 RepID=UPI0030C2C04A
MDTMSGLLDGPRANGAFLLRSVLTAPWSLRVQDEAPLSIAIVVSGEAWVVPDGGDPARLGPGDVMVARGPEPYTISDHPDTPPGVFINPGQRCVDIDGNSLEAAMMLGVRTWGNDPDGETMIVTGTYESTRAISARLLRSLPQLFVLRADEWSGELVHVLCAEMLRDDVGQEVFLDRLLDLVLISAVRDWFARDASSTPAWYRAGADPVLGPALRLLEGDLPRPWTLAMLAAEVGVSRAALARRFSNVLGEPAMAYLTTLRLDLAADLLREPDLTIAAVARQVGYGSPFALSAAFKRVRGVSPAQHRALVS